MEIYIIGICIALFVAYKVHSETQKKMRSSLSLGAKPKVSDYANTFFSLLFSLAKDAAKGGMNELNKNASKSYSEKKSAGKSSQLGTIKVAGGLLPKHGSIGTIEFYFDGEFPKYKRSQGALKFYETNGNIQVFFKSANDEKNIKFMGTTVDMYRRY